MQFFYKREEIIDVTKENPTGTKVVLTDSFNAHLVTRTSESPDGTRLIVLNDGHSESRYDNYPVIKGGKVVGEEFRKEAAYYESHVLLSPEDSKRYVKEQDILLWS